MWEWEFYQQQYGTPLYYSAFYSQGDALHWPLPCRPANVKARQKALRKAMVSIFNHQGTCQCLPDWPIAGCSAWTLCRRVTGLTFKPWPAISRGAVSQSSSCNAVRRYLQQSPPQKKKIDRGISLYNENLRSMSKHYSVMFVAETHCQCVIYDTICLLFVGFCLFPPVLHNMPWDLMFYGFDILSISPWHWSRFS